MSQQISTFLHGLLITVQVLNALGKLLPAQYQVWAALIVGAMQGVLAVAAHYWNPDGTPATVAFIPK